MKKKSQTENASQLESFIKAARELGCDEDEAHFEEKLKKVARHKPPDGVTTQNPKKPKMKRRVE